MSLVLSDSEGLEAKTCGWFEGDDQLILGNLEVSMPEAVDALREVIVQADPDDVVVNGMRRRLQSIYPRHREGDGHTQWRSQSIYRQHREDDTHARPQWLELHPGVAKEPFPVAEGTIQFLGKQIARTDFVPFVEYVMTNTVTRPNDPRLELLEELRGNAA